MPSPSLEPGGAQAFTELEAFTELGHARLKGN